MRSKTLESLFWTGASDVGRSELAGDRSLSRGAQVFLYAVIVFGLLAYQISHSAFASLTVHFQFYLVLSLGLLAHTAFDAFIEDDSGLREALPYVDAVMVFSAMLVFGSSSSLFLFLMIANSLLAGIHSGPMQSLKVGVFSAVLSNLALFSLEVDQGLSLNTAYWVYNVGSLSGAVLGGLLSVELKSLALSLEERSRDLRMYRGLSDVLIDNMGAGLLAVNKTGEIVRSNKGASRLFETVKLDRFYLYELSDHLWAKVRDIRSTQQFEMDLKNLQGSVMRLEVMASPLITRENHNMGWVIMVQNRTEIKNLEEALRQKDKLAAVGQLAAGIAHEIRNPLASISGSVQLLSTSLSGATDEDHKLLNIVLREIDRLNDLIAEFLDYVRPEVVASDRININELLSEVLKMVDLNPKLPEVQQETHFLASEIFMGHYDKLKQAFLNILINAYQAMDKSEDRRVVVSTSMAEGDIVVTIQDTGCGISKDGIRRMFEPFHTTKSGGTGLGLAITHKILESHNAKVQVSSEMGAGTEIQVRFAL